MHPAAPLATLAGTSLRVQAPPSARAWPVGQTLSATVLAPGGGGRPSVLQVGGEAVQAHSRVALAAGQTLRLQVAEAGPPALLKIVAPASGGGVPVLAAKVLRAVLPEQRPLAESLARLQQVSDRPQARAPGDLPHPARALLADLLSSIPRPADAGDGARLAAMVRTCGLFHEAEQARRADPARALPATAMGLEDRGGADFKARIAAVADALRHAVGRDAGSGAVDDADRALRAAVARIEMNQALSVRGSQEHAGALWRMDLPFADERGAQAVGLRIRREAARGAHDGGVDGGWVVELDVEPPGAPALHARVSLAHGVVQALFSTADAGLLSRLRERGGELARRLEGESLAVGGVRSRLAQPPGEDVPDGLDALVDARA